MTLAWEECDQEASEVAKEGLFLALSVDRADMSQTKKSHVSLTKGEQLS